MSLIRLRVIREISELVESQYGNYQIGNKWIWPDWKTGF
jgi:hypothetical protein